MIYSRRNVKSNEITHSNSITALITETSWLEAIPNITSDVFYKNGVVLSDPLEEIKAYNPNFTLKLHPKK